MKRSVLLSGAILSALLSGQAYAGTITSAGSTTVEPIMKACSAAFQQSHPDIQFVISGGGSSKGVKLGGSGKVDIGRASRNVESNETAMYSDLKTFKVGTDGVAIIVNKKNPVATFTTDQIQNLFSGNVTNWKDVGGSDAPVTLISLGTEHGTYELFTKKFHLKGSDQGDAISFGGASATKADTQTIVLGTIARNVNAIGFASIGTAARFAAKTHRVVLTALDGVAATESNVSNGSYKLVRPLLLMTKGDPKADVKSFIDFTEGAECQKIIADLGYIPNK